MSQIEEGYTLLYNERLHELKEELERLNAEVHELEEKIAENVVKIQVLLIKFSRNELLYFLKLTIFDRLKD
ncbi:MAG: hypothetical protein WAV32_09490 [Halobacteriota archaeon]